jgi:hypothetical protein
VIKAQPLLLVRMSQPVTSRLIAARTAGMSPLMPGLVRISVAKNV